MHAVFLGLALVIGGANSNAVTIAHPSSADRQAHTLRQALMAPGSTQAPVLKPVWRERPFVLDQLRPPAFRPQHVKSPRLRAGVAGAALGLLAGAVLGYVVTTRSDCDTCGLAGLFIGAPIGSVIGAVVAVKLK